MFFHSVQVTCSIAHGAVRLVAVAEDQRRVVLDRRVPELRAQQRRVQRQRPGEPVGEVEQMHALVDQLAAARALRAAARHSRS